MKRGYKKHTKSRGLKRGKTTRTPKGFYAKKRAQTVFGI